MTVGLKLASLAFALDSRYEAATKSTGGIIHGKTTLAISCYPDIPCFLLLDDPANELLLSVGLGANRILTLAPVTIGLFANAPIAQRRFDAYGLRCWVHKARILG